MEPTHLGADDDDLAVGGSSAEPVYVQTRVEIKWWAMVVSVGASLLSATLAIVLVLAVRADSRRTSCALIVSNDETYREAPPSTPTGQLQAKKIRQLRADLGCMPHEGK